MLRKINGLERPNAALLVSLNGLCSANTFFCQNLILDAILHTITLSWMRLDGSLNCLFCRSWKRGLCYGNSSGIGNTCHFRHYYLPRYVGRMFVQHFLLTLNRDVPPKHLPVSSTSPDTEASSPPPSPVNVRVGSIFHLCPHVYQQICSYGKL